MKKSRAYVLAVVTALVSLLACLFKNPCWSTYYRIKYITFNAPRHASLQAVSRLVGRNPFYNQHYAILANMEGASSSTRLEVVDIRRRQVVYRTQVMHGRNSGKTFATEFSNRLGSNKTALGRYVIVGQYQGKFGKAYRLAGLDATNSNALARSIVLHQSKYVHKHKIGRSMGCPAVSPQALASMVPYLKEGTLIWLYKSR